MATQYIKDTKKCKKKFFLNYRGGHGPFWPGGGYAHVNGVTIRLSKANV